MTVLYSMHLVYQMHAAFNLESEPRFIRDFLSYFSGDVDIEYSRISGHPFSNDMASSMKICKKFVAGVYGIYWAFYITLLVGAIVRTSSPHVILSLTWPPQDLSLVRRLMSFTVWIYSTLCYISQQ